MYIITGKNLRKNMRSNNCYIGQCACYFMFKNTAIHGNFV
jgi:hypothetical protein